MGLRVSDLHSPLTQIHKRETCTSTHFPSSVVSLPCPDLPRELIATKSAYEGLKPKEIKQLCVDKGLNTAENPWDIWRDGCVDGESPVQITARIDSLIKDIRDIQGPNMNGESPADVVIVAHGHFTRCFAKRWLGYPLDFGLSLMMEPGGVGVLSYQHHNVKEPALLLGIGFPKEE